MYQPEITPPFYNNWRGIEWNRLESSFDRINDCVTRLNRTALRFALTCEFDVMVELAGTRLSERWRNWARSASFLADSRSNVSFYRPE
jgi:hypothetical protein